MDLLLAAWECCLLLETSHLLEFFLGMESKIFLEMGLKIFLEVELKYFLEGELKYFLEGELKFFLEVLALSLAAEVKVVG